MNTRPLTATAKRVQVLQLILDYQDEHRGVSPSRRELCKALGISLQALANRIDALEELKLLTVVPQTARALVVEDSGRALARP